MSFHGLRLTIVLFPLLTSFVILLGFGKRFSVGISIWVSAILWWISIYIVIFFDYSTSSYQIVESYPWFNILSIGSMLSIGVDGISLSFILRTTILTPRCIISSYKGIGSTSHTFYARFIAIEAIILIVFIVIDRMAFYIAFEAVLIPMYRIIGIYGSRSRKVRASYIFFRYTLVGSVLRLVSLLYIIVEYGSSDIDMIKYSVHISIDVNVSRVRWLACFLGIAVKVPIVPVHIWLPEAHVEAPTGGSVILAGILLKRGTYGIIRVRLGILSEASLYYSPFVYTISVIGIVYPALTALRQTDIKRRIAYASVSHINITIVGRWTCTMEGIQGSLLQIISHGLVAGGLFIRIGVRYDRYHTRIIAYYGGRAHTIPIFSLFIIIRIMANIGRPGTSSFVGEWIIIVGAVRVNKRLGLMSAIGIVRGAAYSLWILNRIIYGNRKITYRSLYSEEIMDIDRREFFILLLVTIGTLLRGRYPSILLNITHVSVGMLREQIKCI